MCLYIVCLALHIRDSSSLANAVAIEAGNENIYTESRGKGGSCSPSCTTHTPGAVLGALQCSTTSLEIST